MTATVPTIISDEMRRCIDNCLSCHAVCEATLSYCLAHDGAHADRNGVLLLLDCAEICRTSAGFLLRGSGLHAETCRACARVCGACADWCDRCVPRSGDEAMRHDVPGVRAVVYGDGQHALTA